MKKDGLVNRDKRGGQALVEVMVALTALTVGFMGIVVLLNQSLNANRMVSTEYVATYLAIEGTEAVKTVIDSNLATGQAWDTGLNSGGASAQRYTLNPSATDVHSNSFLNPLGNGADVPALQYCAYAYPPGYTTYCPGYPNTNSGPAFKRFITISEPNPGEIKVIAHVSTTIAGSGAYGLDIETHYFNWTQ
ncbi:MAG TPA: hypothetical protein VMC43_03210 [Candidatus Paceibacterota bacterium]|nr:hypothetical protein [Candidatus Paceibacterota bacterium]